jgi:hypothetical protein
MPSTLSRLDRRCGCCRLSGALPELFRSGCESPFRRGDADGFRLGFRGQTQEFDPLSSYASQRFCDERYSCASFDRGKQTRNPVVFFDEAGLLLYRGKYSVEMLSFGAAASKPRYTGILHIPVGKGANDCNTSTLCT